VSTWLHSIVRNAALDIVRRRRDRASGDGPTDDWSVRGGYHKADLRMDVSKAIRKLPRDQRDAVLLMNAYGYGAAMAADKLGVTEETIKTRALRGRRALAKHLAPIAQSGLHDSAIPSGLAIRI
jgi:RNA polymerase sigma-70 factor (ECF subfamily)